MITFALFDAAGSPLAGAAPSFLAYADGSGEARTPPSIIELGSGLYTFAATYYDEQAGTAYLVDGGASAEPRYYSGAMGLLVAFAFYGDAGAPLAGLTPTFASYRDRDGASLEQPAIVGLGGGLYGFTPSASARAAGATYLVVPGASALPAYYSGTVPDEEPAPSIPEIEDRPAATRLALAIAQGATWKREFAAGIDLTGYTARMEIRAKPGGPLRATPTLAVTDAVAGTITAYLRAEETAAFSWRDGVYDLEVAAGDVVLRLFEGSVSVSPEVTVT